MVGQRLVRVVHVGRMVFVVVDFHRLGVDVRLQRFVGVGQIGKFEGTGQRCVRWLGGRDQGGKEGEKTG